MAGLNETDEWADEVYQIEMSDPVVGGAPNEGTGAGMSNIPHLQLAKRTRWLKTRVDQLLGQVVAATTAVAGIVRLSTATNSTSTTTAATPSAVKDANDNAELRALKSTTITPTGLATGGGDLSANRTITVAIATQAEAEAGTSNTKAMTPLRVAQAMAYGGAGAVGSYVFARTLTSSTTSYSIGSTIAGADLVPAGLRIVTPVLSGSVEYETGDNTGLINTTVALSGTWLCMGSADNYGTGASYKTTLWKRIA